MIKIRGDLDGERRKTTILLLTRAVRLLRLSKKKQEGTERSLDIDF